MGDRIRRMAILAGLAFAAPVAAAPDVPARFPPGPWLTDVRVQGPDAVWPGIFPADPDLPSATGKPGAHGVRVDARQTAFAAREAMAHPLPEWWQSVPVVRSFTPVPSANREVLVADTRAVRLWFIDRGWLDCTVRLELSEDMSVWGRWLNRRVEGGALRATFIVDPGERWSVRDVEIDGLDSVKRPLQRALWEAVTVEAGAYDAEARAHTEGELARLLSERGFSHPLVASVLVPHRDTGSVTVLFHIDPGQRALFGELEIEGLSRVNQERLARRVAPSIPEGSRWDSSRLEAIEDALVSIPSFADVAVKPGEMDGQRRVPVEVTVAESDRTGLFPIVEIASDPTFYAVEVGAGYRSNVVGSQLATFEGRIAGGYRSFPVPLGPDAFWGNHGPVGRASLSNELFLLPLSGLSVVVEAEGSLEAVRANNMASGAFRSGFRVRPADGLELSLTPELALWRSFAWAAQTDLWDDWFVEPGDPPLPPMLGRRRPEFRPFAAGAMVRLGVDWARVDQAMLPTRGGELHLDAIPIGLAGADPFWRVHLDLRRFVPLGGPRWVLVSRLEGGAFRFHDPSVPSVPQLRFRLGGGSSLRGWGIAQANPPGWDGGPNDYRIGGNVLAVGSLEARYRVWPRLHFFGFSDIGRTWESLADRLDPVSGVIEPGVRLTTLLPSAGLGIALPTPVGRAALSGAVRLREETELVNPPPMALVHFSLVQAY